MFHQNFTNYFYVKVLQPIFISFYTIYVYLKPLFLESNIIPDFLSFCYLSPKVAKSSKKMGSFYKVCMLRHHIKLFLLSTLGYINNYSQNDQLFDFSVEKCYKSMNNFQIHKFSQVILQFIIFQM